MASPLFILIAVSAVFLLGISKSGFAASLGAVAVPLLALIMPARDAAGMMLPILLALDAVAVVIYRRALDWRIFAIIIPGAMLGTAIGWALSSVISEGAVGLAVGAISVLFALDAWLPLRQKLAGRPASRPWGWFWGTVTGITSFVSHTGGPPYQIYTMPLQMPPLIYAGTAAFVFAMINVSKLVPYFLLGQLSITNLELALWLTPVAWVGIFAGAYLIRRVRATLFYQISYVLIFLLGLKLIYDGSTGLLFPSPHA